MAFVTDREDAVSMALTVTHTLLEVHQLDPQRIGR